MPEHDLIVIGAGPGGYVAAIRAAQLGLKTACIEKEPALGGTCLRIGCIPSKALLESSELYDKARTSFARHGITISPPQLDLPTMLRRKDQVVSMLTKGVDGLFKKNKITRYFGHAEFLGPDSLRVTGAETHELKARHIVVATGSKPAPLRGVELEPPYVGTSTDALAYNEVPGHLAVIGAGFIGLELGSVWKRLGSKVTIIEYLDRILPGMDGETATEAQKLFEKQGLEFILKAKVLGARKEGERCRVEIEARDPLLCDRVLLATGRIPNTDGLGLEKIGVLLDKRGRIPVDKSTFSTTVKNVYAIGDVIEGPMLAHKAEEEGTACVERIVTGDGHVDYNTIPGIAYTHPEIASVGQTEEQLKENNIPYKKGSFPFRANGRAHALGETEGKVKLLAHATTDRLLGAHIIGPRAGDLIAEIVASMTFGASAEDIARTCHAHPTLAEAVKEAALAVDGRTVHL